MQVIDARGRDSRAALGLRHNEGTLQNRLSMQRQALSGPGGANPIALHRLSDVRFNLGGVPADARLTRLADVGVSTIDLLHHRSDETGELGYFPFEDRLAEIEVAEDPVERVAVLVIRCSLEKGPCDLGPVIRRGDR